MRILILHAYSARNRGDGLLVQETVKLLRDSLGTDVQLTLAASDPTSFNLPGIVVIDSQPTWRGYDGVYIRTLMSAKSFDMIVAVGGGYLRFGYLGEALKALLVHGPQLVAASRCGRTAIYLSQSIGPVGKLSQKVLARLLNRLALVCLRDDRSVEQLNLQNAKRAPDLALLTAAYTDRSGEKPEGSTVLSVRAVRGVVPAGLSLLAASLRPFDGYVQSEVSNNNDLRAMTDLDPQHMVSWEQLSASDSSRRVVVAVRLHAALMALNAGHFVVHLAYERKGFGAFSDLGLDRWIHNVNSFDPGLVREQVRQFFNDPESRHAYDGAVQLARFRLVKSRAELVARVQEVSGYVSAPQWITEYRPRLETNHGGQLSD